MAEFTTFPPNHSVLITDFSTLTFNDTSQFVYINDWVRLAEVINLSHAHGPGIRSATVVIDGDEAGPPPPLAGGRRRASATPAQPRTKRRGDETMNAEKTAPRIIINVATPADPRDNPVCHITNPETIPAFEEFVEPLNGTWIDALADPALHFEDLFELEKGHLYLTNVAEIGGQSTGSNGAFYVPHRNPSSAVRIKDALIEFRKV